MMHVNWRVIRAAKNSYAALYAACKQHGHILHPAVQPRHDITCYSLNSLNADRYKDEIASAECITIVGGPHATARPDDVVEYADYCIVGEGEYTLPTLLSSLQHNTGKIPPAGVATKESFRPVDHCVWLNAYPPFSDVKGYIEMSRGCPFRCAYCQTPEIFGSQMRHRTIDQIAYFAQHYHDVRFVSPNAFAYGSDGRNPRFDKVKRLLSTLKNEIYFGTFPSEVRPEFITETSLSLIHAYCANKRLHFGAQSGSDAVLRRLGRGHTVDDVICAVELCREWDLIPVVDVIVGFPFETDEDQRATTDLIRWIVRKGKVHAHYFIPLPGTPLADAQPRNLLPQTQKLLGKLALDGHVSGSWMDFKIRFFRQN